MSDGIKNTLVIIGSLIIILFISVCIGMTTNSFRNKVYDILDVVSEEQVNMQITGYLDQINKLNNEKQDFINQIASLDKSNEMQAQQIKNYEDKINDLNKQIIELTNKLNNVSKTLNNATLTFKYTYNNMFYATFDNAGNYVYHTGILDTKNSASNCSSQDLLNFVNEEEKVIKDILPKSANSSYETSLYVYDFYEIEIQNKTFGMDIVHDETYSFTSNTNLSTKILLNGNQVDIAELSTSLDSESKYSYSVKFEYCVNADNQITDFICNITITN